MIPRDYQRAAVDAAHTQAAAQKLVQFLLVNRLDRGADVQAKPILNRVSMAKRP